MSDMYLISVALKSSILLAAGLLLLLCSWQRSATIRHLICLAALASAAIVPVLALWSPRWSYSLTIPAQLAARSSLYPDESVFRHWPAFLTAIWAGGVLIFAIRSAGGWIILRRVHRSSMPFLCGETEVRIGDVNVPFTFGVVRPVIILPKEASGWDGARLRAVLLHESAHVGRRDCLAKHVALVSRAMLWWNPLAWMLVSRMEQEQERACDEAVLSAGVSPEHYASVLLDTARELSNSLLLGCAMSHASVLRARLEHLFVWRPESRRTGTARRSALAIPVLLALMTGVSCAGKRYPSASIQAGTHLVTYSAPQSRAHK